LTGETTLLNDSHNYSAIMSRSVVQNQLSQGNCVNNYLQCCGVSPVCVCVCIYIYTHTHTHTHTHRKEGQRTTNTTVSRKSLKLQFLVDNQSSSCCLPRDGFLLGLPFNPKVRVTCSSKTSATFHYTTQNSSREKLLTMGWDFKSPSRRIY
jgi:hypothetical protein